MRLVAEPRRNCANVHSKSIQLSRNNETLDFQKSADERETGGYVSYRPCVMEIHNLDRTKKSWNGNNFILHFYATEFQYVIRKIVETEIHEVHQLNISSCRTRVRHAEYNELINDFMNKIHQNLWEGPCVCSLESVWSHTPYRSPHLLQSEHLHYPWSLANCCFACSNRLRCFRYARRRIWKEVWSKSLLSCRKRNEYCPEFV